MSITITPVGAALGTALQQAEQRLAAGDAVAAQALLDDLLLRGPASADAHRLLAIAGLMQGRFEAAVASAREAIRLQPQHPEAFFTLGRAYKAHGDLDGAESAYRRALAMRPDFAEAQVSLGILLKMRGDLAGAIACYRAALRVQPDMAVAHANLGVALDLQREENQKNKRQAASDAAGDAEGAHRRALQLDPGNPDLHKNLGVALMRAHRYADAAHGFNRALTLRPADEDACLQLGACLRKLSADDLAREGFEKWLALNPPKPAVMCALSSVLNDSGESAVALDWAQRAHALTPDALTLQRIGGALSQCRRVGEAVDHFRQSMALLDHHPGAYPGYLMMLNYIEQDAARLMAEYAAYGVQVGLPSIRPPLRARAPGDKLRVGYLSGDLRRHSVTYFISALLEQHDRERFDITCLHTSAMEDPVTARLKALGHGWIDCAELDDDELIERIQAEGIDVLVDLSGHTAHNRMPLLSRGAAPVQIAYLGYPTVTGVPAIDFRISDRTIDPGDQPELGSESVLHCEHSMFCYRPDAEPAVGEPPMLARGTVTFGSFNNLAKLSDHTLGLWAQVLNAVPDSRLFLKTRSLSQPANRDNIERFLGARGIAPERLVFNPWRPDLASHLELYREVDIGLDSFPYNGATTTCEALWMGVPVVTRQGATHPSRMGASLLGTLGRSDWVAHSDEAFLNIAARLARQPEALARWRAGARDAMRRSPLMDHAGFTRGFERLIEQAVAQRAQAA